MHFQPRGPGGGGFPRSEKQSSPDVNVLTMFVTVFLIIAMSAAMLIILGMIAYPAWELLKLGWNLVA